MQAQQPQFIRDPYEAILSRSGNFSPYKQRSISNTAGVWTRKNGYIQNKNNRHCVNSSFKDVFQDSYERIVDQYNYIPKDLDDPKRMTQGLDYLKKNLVANNLSQRDWRSRVNSQSRGTITNYLNKTQTNSTNNNFFQSPYQNQNFQNQQSSWKLQSTKNKQSGENENEEQIQKEKQDFIEKNKNPKFKRISDEEFKKQQVGKALKSLFKAKPKVKQSKTPYIDRALEILDEYDKNQEKFNGQQGKFIQIDGGYGDHVIKMHHIKYRLNQPVKITKEDLKNFLPDFSQKNINNQQVVKSTKISGFLKKKL